MKLHVCVSVDIDRFSDAKLRRDWLPMFDGVSSVRELRAACAQMRELGFAVFPNPDCDHRKSDGGCAGREEPAT